MTTAIPRLLAVAALAAAGALPAQNDVPRPAPAPAPRPAEPAASALSRADADFLVQAAQDGRAEIETSRMALRKSGNPDLRAYAERMVAAHTKTQQELAALARRKGLRLGDTLSLRQQAQLRALAATDGTEFDQGYARHVGVGAHEQALMLFHKAAGGADDADVRAFARKALPSLRRHLDGGRELVRATGLADREAAGGPKR